MLKLSAPKTPPSTPFPTNSVLFASSKHPSELFHLRQSGALYSPTDSHAVLALYLSGKPTTRELRGEYSLEGPFGRVSGSLSANIIQTGLTQTFGEVLGQFQIPPLRKFFAGSRRKIRPNRQQLSH